jgi:CubicO group peptidase (beta-lactamase class C family)
MDTIKITDNKFNGCVLVRKDGKKLIEKAYGYADLPNKVPNALDTRFGTASAGKVFVAVGIMQLIEKGLLKFEDKIGDLLDFDLKDIDKDITVRQLLTHTSGMPDYFDESEMDEYEELWTDFPNYRIRSNRDLIPLFIDKPMMYPKGERFQYNNTGFVVLGIIIEIIAGMSFDEYLKENIFSKCKMNSTGYYELDRLPEKCASSYIFDEKRKTYKTNIYSVDAKGTGAGGAFTTIGDIEKFWDNLIGNKLISEEMTTNMLRCHSSDDDDKYGYGIWLADRKNALMPYFTGSDPGVSFVSSYDRENNLLIVIISNFGDDVWKIHKQITESVFASEKKYL